MAINMNLSANSVYTVPGGYPVRLLPAWDSMLSGVAPKTATSVSATVATESGTANAYLALYTMPTTSGGNDGAQVAIASIIGLTATAQTMTVSVPSGAPTCYVVRIWVDTITGSNADTISRDGSTATSAEPRIPVAVKVSSVSVT